MTPKEKALQLVQRYINEAYQEDEYGLYTPMAKQCALIAVDEILEVDCYDMSEENFDKHIEYYTKVKQEIQAL